MVKARKKKDSIFSANLKTLLKERNITQKQAADLAGVSQSSMNDWINGASPTEMNGVLKLATALRTDFQFLLTGVRSLPTSIEDASLSDLFNIEDESTFSGVFQIEAKRLTRKK